MKQLFTLLLVGVTFIVQGQVLTRRNINGLPKISAAPSNAVLSLTVSNQEVGATYGFLSDSLGIPAGTILPYVGGDDLPIDWVPCDGRLLTNLPPQSPLFGVVAPNWNTNVWPKTNTQPLVVAGGGLTNICFGAATNYMVGTGSGQTYINLYGGSRIRQSGLILGFAAKFSATVSGFKLKVFRDWGGGTYACVASSALINGVAGSNYYTLATPLACWELDYLGVYVANTATANTECSATAFNTNGCTLWMNGDITDAQAGWTSTSNLVCLKAYCDAPVVAFVGDSIISGWNYNSGYYNWPDNGVMQSPWNALAEIFHSTNRVGSSYRTYGKGSALSEYCNTNLFVEALTNKPDRAVVACGINDINNGLAWSVFNTNLLGMRLRLPLTNALYICEILPCHAAGIDDAKSLVVRTWNTNIAIFCSTNQNTYVIKTHDRMGEIRSSTGQYDNLRAAYDSGDHTHLNLAGQTEFAKIIAEYTANTNGVRYILKVGRSPKI